LSAVAPDATKTLKSRPAPTAPAMPRPRSMTRPWLDLITDALANPDQPDDDPSRHGYDDLLYEPLFAPLRVRRRSDAPGSALDSQR
jgi:hypothetical protein